MLKLLTKKIEKIKFKKSSFFTSFYTIQFINPKKDKTYLIKFLKV